MIRNLISSCGRDHLSIIQAIVSVLLVQGLVGCAADRDSQQLAARLRVLTAEYSAASSAKIEVEQQFYLSSDKNLQNTLNVVDPTKESPSPKDSLAYGRIVTATNSASLKLAGELIDNAGSASASPKITAFVQDGIRSEDQAFREAREQEAKSAIAMATDFVSIEQYQATLSDLTRQLAELEKPTSSSERASEAAVLGQAAIEQIKKGQSPTK